MKIVIIIFTLLFLSKIHSIELTKAEVLPKKLLFAELPENYPPEIDDLFQFYHEMYREVYSRINNYSDWVENRTITENNIKELSLDEIRRFVYWEWLAKKHIPYYFWEFLDLHHWIILNDEGNWSELLPYKQEILNLVYHPKKIMNAVSDGNYVIGLPWIRHFLYQRYLLEINEFYLINQGNTEIRPIIGKVVNVTPLQYDGDIDDKRDPVGIRNYEIIEVDSGEEIYLFVEQDVFSFKKN